MWGRWETFPHSLFILNLWLSYFSLFLEEVVPTVVVNENEEKEETKDYLEDSDRVEPFIETNLYLMLDADAYQIVVEDERTMHPTELVSD